ncbi:SDR family NAD(P)-dependent oxidoreductase [Glycocaulis abyssi]|uniref:SDR family NAD(P)-dependent oxidoreductase n=1 Tax=Glycocaulis abyssi TaxID=1433403 RepID=A0ABV9N867_9PROT
MGGRLDGKVAVITGGASGIGKASVERFIAEGAHVVMGDLETARGEAMAQFHGPKLAFRTTDVKNEADIKALIDLAIERHGRLDILFNNAGSAEPDYPVEKIEAGAFDHVMHLHLRAALFGIKHASPHMQAAGGGSIISTSSVAGIGVNYGPLLYSIAKAALIHMTKTVSVRMAPHKIRVNCINPGLIATAVFGRAFGLDQDAAEAAQPKLEELGAFAQPLPVGGNPLDIANAAVYLASDEARFVTGQALVVDGGLTTGTVPDPNGGTAAIITDILGVDLAAWRAEHGIG